MKKTNNKFLTKSLVTATLLFGTNSLYAACSCPAGATEFSSTSGGTLLAGKDYCISSDLDISGSLTLEKDTTLTVTDGVNLNMSGALLQQRSPSEFNICEGAKVLIEGSYTQTGNSGADYNAATPNLSKLKMDEYAGLEICGTWTATPNQYATTTTPVSNLTGNDTTKNPLIIARSGFTSGGQIGDPFDIVNLITMGSNNVQRTSAHEECHAPSVAGDDVSTKSGCSWVVPNKVSIGSTGCGEIKDYPINPSGKTTPPNEESTGTVSGTVKDSEGNPLENVTVELRKSDGTVVSTATTATTGAYSFADIPAGDYEVVETNPSNYSSTSESSDQTGDPANSSVTDDKIPVTVEAGEDDTENNFIDKKDASTGGDALSTSCACPSGATEITTTNGSVTLNNGSDYCISSDLDMTGSVTFQPNTTLTVTSGVTWNLDGSIDQIDSPSKMNICEEAKVIVHGQYKQIGNRNNDNTESLLKMDDYAGLEICGSWQATPKSYYNATPIVDMIGDEAGKTPLIITRAGVSAYGEITAESNRLDFIRMQASNVPENTVHNKCYAPTYDNDDISTKAGCSWMPTDIVHIGASNCGELLNYPVNGKPIGGGSTIEVGNIKGTVKDEAGNPIVGAKVKLVNVDGTPAKDKDGNPIAEVTVDETTGAYEFLEVPVGAYQIVETDPVGYTSISDSQSSDDDTTANAETNDNVIPVTVTKDENDINNDFVDKAPVETGSIKGTVKDDKGEPLKEVLLTLKDSDGKVVDTAKTDDNGAYEFSNVPVGEYTVTETDPETYTSVSDIDNSDDADTTANTETNDNVIPVTVTKDEDDVNNDFVDKANGSAVISGKVYDLEGNPVDGAKVKLVHVDGTAVNGVDGKNISPITVDNITGAYEFINVPAGDFKVIEINPEDYKSIKDIQSIDGDKLINSNINDDTIPVTVALGEVDANNDFVDYKETFTVTDDKEIGVRGEPVTVDVIANDTSDTPLDATTVKILDESGSPVEELVVENEGTWSVDEESGKITFTPEEDFVGDPTPIEYIVDDENGVTAEPATVTVDYPESIAVTDDSKIGEYGELVTVNPLANDNGETPLDPTTVMIIDEEGNLVRELIVANEGRWSVDEETGEITFTPEDGFNANPTPINYKVEDENGQESEPAKVTITYPPVITSDVRSNIELGQAAVVTVLDNDNRALLNIDTLKIKGTKNSGESLTVVGEGVWSIEEGKIIFTPEEGFELDPTDIEYTIENKDGVESTPATVSVNYKAKVRPDVQITELDEPVTVNVLENDNGDLNVSTVEIILPEEFMTQHPDAKLAEDGKKLTVPNEGQWKVNGDGTITYTAEKGAPLVDPTPIGYKVYDKSGNELVSDALVTLKQTKVAGVSDENCSCETYEESNVSVFSRVGMFFILLFSSTFGVVAIRRKY